MKFVDLKKILAFTLTATICVASHAKIASNTYCTYDKSTGIIEGKNVDTKYTLASVSKVFTTYWAAKKLGLTYRYPTQVYLTQLPNETYDVHLRGSVFPYFDQTMFYFLIGELNKRGINKINNLSYDENFEYASVIRTNSDLAHSDGEQSETEIMRELRRDVTNLQTNYKRFLKKSQGLTDFDLRDKVTLSVKDIHAKSVKNFDAGKTSSNFILKSSELHRILKEMNRNSHNFAADKIYERLSRTENFSDFLIKDLNISSKEFRFYNGSGYPEFRSGQKVYNEATCRVVVTLVKELTDLATDAKLGLRYVLPVAGIDADADGDSTVSNLYSSSNTNKALLGKTGTVQDTIALGGALLTQDDLVYFHISIDNHGTGSDRAKSYQAIRDFLRKTIESNNGKKEVPSYTPEPFLPFDKDSVAEPAPAATTLS